MLLKNLLHRDSPLANAYRRIRAAAAARRARRMIDAYLAVATEPKLQLGCGSNVLTGWLNTDRFAQPAGVAHLDVTRPFPLPDATFRFVLLEHMIEHVTLVQARAMLAECRRILAPGGVIRVSTPDLDRYLSLYSASTQPPHKSVIRELMQNWIVPGFHAARTYPPPAGAIDDPVYVLNDVFFNYEHRFIYNRLALERTLRDAGFDFITSHESGLSPHVQLCGIETHRSPTMQYLTLVLEAVAPPPP